jgi:hypothetical protein
MHLKVDFFLGARIDKEFLCMDCFLEGPDEYAFQVDYHSGSRLAEKIFFHDLDTSTTCARCHRKLVAMYKKHLHRGSILKLLYFVPIKLPNLPLSHGRLLIVGHPN